MSRQQINRLSCRYLCFESIRQQGIFPDRCWCSQLLNRVTRQMIRIRNLVQQALLTGYLTIEAEEQLRQMLAKKYDLEDLEAFMNLQQAAMAGTVKQESRELLRS